MALVFSINGLPVIVHSNDHARAHVHVAGLDRRARFELNCPDGPVRLMDQQGFRHAELNRIGAGIAARLGDCCARWSEMHGQV